MEQFPAMLLGMVVKVFKMFSTFVLGVGRSCWRKKMTSRQVCDDCINKTSVCTADFGGQVECILCEKIQYNVPSISSRKICFRCNGMGFCRDCGKKIETNKKLKGGLT